MARHAVVWLDHEEAEVIPLVRQGWTEWALSPDEQRVSARAGPGSLGDGHYFDEIVAALKGAARILIVGPGPAKHQLMRHLSTSDPETMGRVAGVESMDRPSPDEILKLAREFFRSAAPEA